MPPATRALVWDRDRVRWRAASTELEDFSHTCRYGQGSWLTAFGCRVFSEAVILFLCTLSFAIDWNLLGALEYIRRKRDSKWK